MVQSNEILASLGIDVDVNCVGGLSDQLQKIFAKCFGRGPSISL
jgi:hypothetical protein